jgi:hypothetical protein
MTAEDRRAFAELMLGIGEAYGEPVSDIRLEIYFSALEDLPLDDIRQAANIHVRVNKFFPRISELREAIDGSAEDQAELAWVQLLRLVRSVGAYGKPTWPDHQLKRAALELYGGWGALCARLPGEGPELLGMAKLFKAIYVAYARRDSRDEMEALSPAETHARLLTLRDDLVARGLPAPGLPKS